MSNKPLESLVACLANTDVARYGGWSEERMRLLQILTRTVTIYEQIDSPAAQKPKTKKDANQAIGGSSSKTIASRDKG